MHMFRKSRALIFSTNVFLNTAGTVLGTVYFPEHQHGNIHRRKGVNPVVPPEASMPEPVGNLGHQHPLPET